MKKEVVFTENEFHLICDALNGSQYLCPDVKYYWEKLIKDDSFINWRENLVSDVLDLDVIELLVEKWDVDEIDFALKLREIQETNEFLDLLEKVDRFWKATKPLGRIRNN